uniref:NADH-ubiquinone oxidoreductase chain 6 n=1 Tax=Pelecotoma fennica TaxID=433262 RepID=A0A343A489_9CUCU|nr:NADH dehydrogenase subunit 6 [Pelecotoma fennica]AOY39367.1 NADH dehydrogenase subunit 6 [Pelecotoma fennica]
MLFMMSLSISLTMLLLILNHPLSMGMILLIQTILISSITSKMNINFWFSYMLILTLISGMLVLFIYMTSIASNKKFKFNWKTTIMVLMPPFLSHFSNINYFITYKTQLFSQYNFNPSLNWILNKLLNLPTNLILMFMFIYLFLTLIASVKITKFSMGPLRTYNK